MLLQRWVGSVLLLPALPKAWPRGSVRDVRVRGGRYQLSDAGQTLDLDLGPGHTQQVGLNNNRWVTQ